MIKKIESQKIRKHPGGLLSILRSFKILLSICVALSGIAVMIALVTMFGNSDISVYVLSNARDISIGGQTSFNLTNIKTAGLLNFEPRNIFEWLFLPRYNEFDIYISSITFFITWHLYNVLKEINLDNPFYEGILKRITFIYQLIFCGFVFGIFRYFYFMNVIGDITHKTYNLNIPAYISSTGYFSLGTWIIVYLFVYVYKKGVKLQGEQDLTI